MAVDPQGDVGREAIDSLGGYVYQIYRSALAWLDLSHTEFLYVEVAEDFAVAAKDALTAVQVKETTSKVTLNSDDIVTTIDSFVTLMEKNPSLEVRMIHLTTSAITKEQSKSSRIEETPFLKSWMILSRAGDLTPLREVLDRSKLADRTKNYIKGLDDQGLRTGFLQRIRFECGALNVDNVHRLLLSKLSGLIIARGGGYSQSESCLNTILIFLLKLSTQKDNRKTDRAKLEEIVEKATHISINKSVLEEQFLGHGMLAAAYGVGAAISADQQLVGSVHSVNKIPLPVAIANRQGKIDEVVSTLVSYGVAWIYGASGVGKTLSAKLATKKSTDNWSILNLRALVSGQAALKISCAAEMVSKSGVGGLIVDDLDHLTVPDVRDAVLYLCFVCENYRLPLIVAAFQPPSSELLHSLGLPGNYAIHISEFTKEDLQEILNNKDVHHSQHWANYIHLVSGGGHPQLAIAAIQSMERNQWDAEELKTLDALLVGNSDIEQVRVDTRQRLYQELAEQDKRLLERLSLKLGSFDRSLVLSIAEVDPYISDAGYILDRHIGSWIDQQADDLYSLSPLLTGLAEKNVSESQKVKIHYAIAALILRDRTLNPIDADSALFSAWRGHNTEVIIKVCIAVIQADRDELEMIAPYMSMLRGFRTDKKAYTENAFVSAIFRGAQLILIANTSEKEDRFSDVLECFENEVEVLPDEEQKCFARMMFWVKVLTSETRFGEVPKFWLYLAKLEEWENRLFPTSLGGSSLPKEKNLPLVGFVFFNQIRQLRNISRLKKIFEYLDSCSSEFREKLFQPIARDDFEVDLLFAGAWLSEHNANTIREEVHESVFSTLESYANKWSRNDIAVVARKYRAIIIDEYAESKDKAIALLDEGMELYGRENHELIRAKAKVYYRSSDHKNSENISRLIIESDAPLSVTEKVFLGREAGISAEHQGDYVAARKYYLYGSQSAGACLGEEIRPMEIGLLADAAIASWHDGDRATCLRDMSNVLSRLHEFEGDTSLRAAHCIAVSRHVVLWLVGEASGKEMVIGDGEVTQIVPGVVSNPEPHEGIKEFADGRPMELAWYMLAAVENYCEIDVGITQGLAETLPSGPVVEGKMFLTSAVRHRAINSFDVNLFVSSLIETLAEFSYYKKIRDENEVFNPLKPTFGDYLVPSKEDIAGFKKFAEGYTLVFSVRCIFESQSEKLPDLIKCLGCTDKLAFGADFFDCLSSKRDSEDYYCMFATLIFQFSVSFSRSASLPPLASLSLVIKALQIGQEVKCLQFVLRPAINWFRQQWAYIWGNQRFTLSLPRLHEQAIADVFNATYSDDLVELKSLLAVTIPVFGLGNEAQIKKILDTIST